MIGASIAVSVIGNAAHAVNDTLTPLLAAAATRSGARLRTRSQSASDGDHRPPHVHGSGLGSEHAKDICRAAERADPQPRLPARATGSARRCAAGPSPTRRRRRETGAGVGRTRRAQPAGALPSLLDRHRRPGAAYPRAARSWSATVRVTSCRRPSSGSRRCRRRRRSGQLRHHLPRDVGQLHGVAIPGRGDEAVGAGGSQRSVIVNANALRAPYSTVVRK
jgi:hypothetical protein